MEKINFEDGQLVKAGYIEIDGTKHFITEAEYDGATPLSSFILNKMQSNIETAIGEVSSFDPVIVTELPSTDIKEKTMYLVLSNDKGTIEKYDAYIYKDNEWKQIGSAEIDPSKLTVNLVENSYKLTLTQAVAGGGTITVPSQYKVGLDRLDVFLNGEKLIKASSNDEEGHYYEVGTEGTLSNMIRITNDWPAKVGDVFEFTIRTNGQGVTEESLDIYSTNEQIVGKWINGKSIYRKVFEETNVEKGQINLNNLNIEDVIDCRIKTTANIYISFLNMYTGESNINYFTIVKNANEINLVYRNNGNVDKMVVIIEYTKTTD